jgi:hypothetical protein
MVFDTPDQHTCAQCVARCCSHRAASHAKAADPDTEFSHFLTWGRADWGVQPHAHVHTALALTQHLFLNTPDKRFRWSAGATRSTSLTQFHPVNTRRRQEAYTCFLYSAIKRDVVSEA